MYLAISKWDYFIHSVFVCLSFCCYPLSLTWFNFRLSTFSLLILQELFQYFLPIISYSLLKIFFIWGITFLSCLPSLLRTFKLPFSLTVFLVIRFVFFWIWFLIWFQISLMVLWILLFFVCFLVAHCCLLVFVLFLLVFSTVIHYVYLLYCVVLYKAFCSWFFSFPILCLQSLIAHCVHC